MTTKTWPPFWALPFLMLLGGCSLTPQPDTSLQPPVVQTRTVAVLPPAQSECVTSTGVGTLATAGDLEADREAAHKLLRDCAAKNHTTIQWRKAHAGGAE